MTLKKHSSKKLFKKGGEAVDNKLLIKDITIDDAFYNETKDDKQNSINPGIKSKLYLKICEILEPLEDNNIKKIKELLEKLTIEETSTDYSIVRKSKSSIIPYFKNIFDDISYVVSKYINKSDDNAKKVEIPNACASQEDITDDYQVEQQEKPDSITDNYHFQSDVFENPKSPDSDSWKYSTIFSKYNLGGKENQRTFITVDPSIIQLLIFDENDENVVYSLKLIIKQQGVLTLRYTTKIFPKDIHTYMDKGIVKHIEIDTNINCKNLASFINYNKTILNGDTMDLNKKLLNFLNSYNKFYEFYKKCYTLPNGKLTDYQLKYISILGKARFRNKHIKRRTATITDYVMSNLIFASPTYGFMSGGFKGYKDDVYGITRSGYEIAKKYNRPILTIMCKEGTYDAHEYSDATLIYGEHWGEDTIALSQLTDGAIVFAPFGGWTYVECLALLEKKKIVGIYNDSFNILNYRKKLTYEDKENLKLSKVDNLRAQLSELDDESFTKLTNNDIEKIINLLDKKHIAKNRNKHFFSFAATEQNSIIDYYINYYLILMYLIRDLLDKDDFKPFNKSLQCGIQILMILKSQFKYVKPLLVKPDFDRFIGEKFFTLINSFRELKVSIDSYVSLYIEDDINKKYNIYVKNKDYQGKIPSNCDGIWIKPRFDLITNCITDPYREEGAPNLDSLLGGRSKKGGDCTKNTLYAEMSKYIINIENLNDNFMKNINNNIIFVFSDVMFLNIYLNENLNKPSFQTELKTKIKDLSDAELVLELVDGGVERSESSRNLIIEETTKKVSLNRHLDDMLNDKGDIIISNMIKKDYIFIINEECNQYVLEPNKSSSDETSIPSITAMKKQSSRNLLGLLPPP